MELTKRIIGLANQIIEAVDLGNIEEPQASHAALTVTVREWEDALIMRENDENLGTLQALNTVLSRRAAPQAKEPRERVTVIPRTSRLLQGMFDVYLDGVPKLERVSEENANIYAAGLRAELEAK